MLIQEKILNRFLYYLNHYISVRGRETTFSADDRSSEVKSILYELNEKGSYEKDGKTNRIDRGRRQRRERTENK